VNPPPISGTSPVTATITLTTSPNTMSKLTPGGPSTLRLGGTALACLLCCCLLPTRRRRLKTLLSLLLLSFTLAATQGCSGSNNALPNVGGTARGTYTVTITGSGPNGVAAATTISLNVQ
jgi:hypothetical protein